MADYSQPFVPNASSNADAVIKLQSYFDSIQKQQAMQQAGQLYASDPTAARNMLMGGGQYDAAAQMQKILAATHEQELNDRNDTIQMLARSAATYGNDPDKWKQITDLIKSRGGNVTGLEDYKTGPGIVQSLAQTAQQRLDDEIKRREMARAEQASQINLANASKPYQDKEGNIWVRRPSGQWENQGKAPPGVDISEPIGGSSDEKMPFVPVKIGGNALTGEGGSVVAFDKRSGAYGKAKTAGEEETQTPPLAAPGVQPPAGAVPTATSAMPAATSAIPAAATLPVPGTKGGEAVPISAPNDAALNGLTEGWKNRIKAWSEGTEEVPKNSRDATTQAAISKLYEYNPNFNRRDIDQAYRFRQQFMAATGRRQNEGVSFNTAVGHGADTINDADFLPSGNKFSTSPGMFYAEFKNDPRLGRYMTDVRILAGEAAKVLHGGQSVATEESIAKSLDPHNGRESVQAAAATLMQRMAQKSEENEQNWRQNMRYLKMPEEMQDYWVMTPTSKQRLEEAKTKLLKSGNRGLPEQWKQSAPKAATMSDDQIRQGLGIK